MTEPDVPKLRSLNDLRALTPARVALGRVGSGLPTSALLAFTLDHARARDAVHAPLDADAIASGVAALGCETMRIVSQAETRADYLRRPDLGRKLDASSQATLAARYVVPCDLAIMIADGLSAAAVHAHAAALMQNLLPRLKTFKMSIGPVLIATGARVALGDEVGVLCKARMMLTLIGERPGLSAPDSLGAYITFAPKPGRTDAERNCVSNIHHAGLSYDEAAFKIVWLVREGLARAVSGVALKDESGIEALPSPARGEGF
ncbi:MAG: ethanolamine ammonia-lyase subunit EutC [Pseudomonadota bacterium]